VSAQADVAIESTDDVIVAHVSGEIDLASASSLGDELASAVSNHALGLVIDLAATTYLDSSGISLVFELAERLRRRQQQLRLVVPEGAPLRRVLGIVDASSTVPVLATIEEATAEIRAAA
jgi:anti-anti-sigma factor